MIFPPSRVRTVVATEPVDVRKGHDGLAAPAENALRKEPFTGTVLVFRPERAARLKPLYRDGTGLVMACKRPEEHAFAWPAIRGGVMALNHAPSEASFSGLDGRKVRAVPARPPTAAESIAGSFPAGACGSILGIRPDDCDGESSR